MYFQHVLFNILYGEKEGEREFIPPPTM